MKKTVTSDKTTGSTAEFKKTAAPESKAVATVVPKSVAKTKPAAVKNSVKASAVSILPEQVEVKGEPNLCQEKVAARAYLCGKQAATNMADTRNTGSRPKRF